MIKITYTNGDVQNIKVTGEFFTVTPVIDENGKPVKDKVGKPIRLSPTQKAESLAFDLADKNKTQVAFIDLFYPEQTEPKSKFFRHVDEKERMETGKPTPAFLRDLKSMKKEHKQTVPTNKKGYKTYWKWVF